MKRNTTSPRIKTKIPGPNTKKWVAFHMKHAAESTYFKHFVWDRKTPAGGPFCTDPDGNIFLDFASHVASSPLGYNHPKLIKLALALARIDPDRYAGTDFIGAYGPSPVKNPLEAKGGIPTPSHLHHKLVEITRQFGFKKSFLVNSGSEAVENAIKLCYAARPDAKYAITFTKDFHGRTLGALSLSSSKKIHNENIPQIAGIIRLPFISYECREGICRVKPPSQNPQESIDALISQKPGKGQIKPEEVAFIMLEPVQGEGGYNFPDPLFLKGVTDTAEKYNIPLICDEVQTGMGRTGKWWISEHYGLKPSLITAGKALRVGAVVGKKELFPTQPGRLGSTWGEGNAIASAMGYATIEIIQKENLLLNAEMKGSYFLAELQKMAKQHASIEEARGLGLLLAVELKTPAQRDALQEKLLSKGLLTLGCGEKTIRLLPPLNVTKREIDLALEIIQTCVKTLR